MKVGIITFHFVNNFGGVLQAYAFQNFLTDEFHVECKIIDYRHWFIRLTDAARRFPLTDPSKCLGPWSHTIGERKERKRKFERFIKKHENLTKYYRTYHRLKRNEDEFDLIICGSDQIWNPSFTFLSPFYWLAFLPEGKDAIAYAPSLGTAEFGNDDRETVKRYLLRFKAISTREENSGKMLETIDPRIRVSHVSDPTFLPGADFWKSKVKSTKSEKKYLFAYLIKGNDRQREYIEAVARERQLELVTYPYLENHRITKSERTWGDVRCFGDDPFDFLTKIYNAELIITDSFHCSVFSLQFRKDFYALKKCGDTTGQFNRIEQLLKACGMSGRMISEDKPFRRAETDFDASDRAIAALREESRAYLDRALS